MPTKTKTPTRKAKKPTLADRFKSLHLEIFDARGATVSHINSVNDRVTELFKLLECRLPKPTDPPPAEQPIGPGDWVVTDNEQFSCPGTPVQVEEVFSNSGRSYLGFGKLGKWHAAHFRRVPPPAEKWVPLVVGSFVKKGPHFHSPINDPGAGTPDDAVGVVAEVRCDDDPRWHLYGCDFPGASARVFGFTRPGGSNHFTPLSDAEIAEHKRTEEESKVTELQEGDQCDRVLTKEEVFETVNAAVEPMAGHILSLMRRVKHDPDCMMHQPEWMGVKCTCGLDAELKSIEELIHPTT